MSEKPKVQEIQIIYHATTRWPLSDLEILKNMTTFILPNQKVPIREKHGPQPKADDKKPRKLTEKSTAPLKMESVTSPIVLLMSL